MTIKLTKKQALIIEFINDFTGTRGVSPTYREIMTALGLSSVSAVAELFRQTIITATPQERTILHEAAKILGLDL